MNPDLLSRMQELRDLAGLTGLASWDQETYLPKKAHQARAAQLATLQGLYHERLVDPRLGDWLDDARAGTEDELAMVRVLAKERERAVRIPSRLVKALALAQSKALVAWRAAREARSYQPFEPALAELLVLRREQADLWGHGGERYDALLEAYEPGMTTARLLPVLEGLKAKLVPMVEALGQVERPAPLFGSATFDLEGQWAFTLEILRAMGFDFDAGRQDKSVHPFTGGTHPTDVRLTNRFSEKEPLSAVFSALHEGGHGLYEQGFDPSHARTPLAQAPSMGLHESQSRLWENLVGRSRAFWSHFLPKLQAHFRSLDGVGLDRFLGEVCRVAPSFIRVEADEVTYNLHIVLRTELEVALMRGALSTAELEQAWNDKVREMLGLTVTDPLQGVLQDIHWAWGELGYFPTYALGNLYAASLFRTLKRDVGGLDEALARGELSVVREWLRQKVHHMGYRLEGEALVERVTGHGLDDADFIEALKSRYAPLYGVVL